MRAAIRTVAVWFVLPTAVSAATGVVGCRRHILTAAATPVVPASDERSAPSPEPPPPAWTYWEPIDVPILPAFSAPLHSPVASGLASEAGAPATDFPVDPAQLLRTLSADARWAAAAPSFRDALATRGLAVRRSAHPTARLGDFYASLRDDRVPWVVTLDALFFLTHLALERALSDVDLHVMRPSLATMLRRLDLHLGAESRTAQADMVRPYLVARGIVAVALALCQPGYRPAPELSALVDGETSRIVAHAGPGVSPWLQTALDYSALSPRGMADHDEASAGWFRAASWLEHAALSLEGTGEATVRSALDVGVARVHARAALLLTRLVDHEVDAEAATAWARIQRAGELVIGEGDDITPRELSAAVSSSGFDLRNTAWLANIVRVDRVRHAASQRIAPGVYDGSGGALARSPSGDGAGSRGIIAPAFRLLGPPATPDGELLQSLVFPSVGSLAGAESPPTARGRWRAFPSALDVAAWLGSASARAALHETGDDAFERYADILERLGQSRSPGGSLARHRTPYLSMIDAIETWLAPSAGDRFEPGATQAAWRQRKADVALAAWTELRHDATAFTRLAVEDIRLPPRIPAETFVPAFVEAHPEAIAKLLAVVRQTSRTLLAEGALSSASPALTVLDEVDDLLWTAFGAAVYETADESLPPSVAAALSAFPARLRALEAVLAESGDAQVPIAMDVHTDLPSGQTLEEATGRIEEAWMVVREPGTHWLWLALGAAIPHDELVQPAARRWSDGAWRAYLGAQGDPPLGVLARAYATEPSSVPREDVQP